MPVERPTFHESWYRVAGLHPRLRSTVQITRQFFRNQSWHVVQDHTNNAFFRLSEPAYRFVGMLDGKRSVGEAWRICNDQLGDDAPTQGEAIQLLGQLYTSNLLMAELPSDTQTLFNRYKKRRTREIQGYLMNLMFIRLPLFDPDAWLERWLPLLGWIFSPVGFVVWMLLAAFGVYNLVQKPDWVNQIFQQSNGILAPDNLILLYVGFALTKACHEMGHAISCKKFGKQGGTGGEVHTIGIMFLIFTPVPYVDASSSWAFTNKWHRAIVGAAGMWVELAIASIAAVVWAHSRDNTVIHGLAYNMMFVASVSTVIFNANPLLRYDGYYILSDLLEIPNLTQRAKEFIYYLIKTYLWRVRFVRNPAYSTSERFWLFTYAIASAIMRVVVSVGILFYLATTLQGPLIFLAAAMALAGIFTWVFIPIGKFTHYLATSAELSRVRGRAVLTSVVFFGAVLGALGLISVPDRSRAQGVVEPLDIQDLNLRETGQVQVALAQLAPPAKDPFGMPVAKAGQTILEAESRELRAEIAQLQADLQERITRRNMAFAEDPDSPPGTLGRPNPAKHAALDELVKATEETLRNREARLAELQLRAPIDGVVVSEEMEIRHHAHLNRGEKIGLIANLDMARLIIRCAVPNDLSGTIEKEARHRVEIRVLGRPDIFLTGRIYSHAPAGQDKLPAASLGYAAGGAIATDHQDRNGLKTAEQVFEIRINDLKFEHRPSNVNQLLPGQRVVVRFDFDHKPLLQQGWIYVQQLFQQKFRS